MLMTHIPDFGAEIHLVYSMPVIKSNEILLK